MNSIYYTFLDFGTIWMCDYISHSCLLIFVCLRICFHGAPRRGFQQQVYWFRYDLYKFTI